VVVLTEASIQGNIMEQLRKARRFRMPKQALLVLKEFCEYFKYNIMVSVVIEGLKLVLNFAAEIGARLNLIFFLKRETF
jgi:hypothetical protein